MNKNIKKTLLQLLAAVVVFAALFFGIKAITQPKVTEGDKTIKIVILDKDKESAYDETFDTDTELLGDLIDEINESEDEALFELEGSKDDEFGRMITDTKVVETEEGEFWVYDSDNNTICEEEGFCPGIDALAIEDGNNFSFNILDD